MKRSPIKRYKRLESHSQLRRSPLLRGSGLNPQSPKRRRMQQRDDVPTSVRRAVRDRSGGWCECGCGRRAEHVHHRRLRSQGGRHELVNLLHLSNVCHQAAHANPERSYSLGLLVHGWADPADVPVVRIEGAAA